MILGHKHIPVQSVGSYIPGGRYPMFGSAQMSIIPAKVAGVDHVFACTPPVKGEGYYPATINAMHKAGADRIFVLGGVPALALMAFGMGVVEPVDMLCGAGNKYVAEAKRQLFGRCGIDLLAGPTEILVIADDAADPALVACDLLGQAEHDPNSGIALVCLSEAFARAATRRSSGSSPCCPPATWRPCPGATTAASTSPGIATRPIAISDDYAPEHLELHVRDPDDLLRPPAQLRLALHRRGDHGAYGDKTHRHESHPAHQPLRALHRRRVGRQVPEDRDLPAHDPGGQPPHRRGDGAAVRGRAHARPRDHRPGARRALPRLRLNI